MTQPTDKFFLPYQAKWIKDESRLKIMEKSRQIGLSWSTAYELVRRTSLRNCKFDAWVSSRDDIQARLFLEDCKSFADIFHIAAEDLGERVVDESKNSAYVIKFSNAFRINSMSSNPDAQAGKRGSRVLDEFALNPDPRKLYAIAYPGITWGGSMGVLSTHRGSTNFFNQLIQEIKHKGNPKGFSLHTVTLQDALDQGFLDKLKPKLPDDDERKIMTEAEYFDFIRAGCPDEETFQQEYMCQPSDDNSAFLSYELIAGCKYKFGEVWEKALKDCMGPLYVGVDVGRDHDLTVIWVLEKLGDCYYTRLVIEMQNKTFEAQEHELYGVIDCPKVKRVCIDGTGIGRQFVERAQKRFGTYKVENVQFTGPVKEELAFPLRAAFEDRTIRIPDDEKLTADLRGVKKETTASGNIRFAADRGKNGHSDRFWGLSLALHAGKSGGEIGRIIRLGSGGRRSRALAARRERSLVG